MAFLLRPTHTAPAQPEAYGAQPEGYSTQPQGYGTQTQPQGYGAQPQGYGAQTQPQGGYTQPTPNFAAPYSAASSRAQQAPGQDIPFLLRPSVPAQPQGRGAPTQDYSAHTPYAAAAPSQPHASSTFMSKGNVAGTQAMQDNFMDSHAQVNQAFSAIDMDGDGVITRRGFMRAAEGHSVHPERAAQAFDRMDLNHDGVLHRGEFQQGCTQHAAFLLPQSSSMLPGGMLLRPPASSAANNLQGRAVPNSIRVERENLLTVPNVQQQGPMLFLRVPQVLPAFETQHAVKSQVLKNIRAPTKGRALRSWRAWAQQRADSLQAMRRGLGSLMNYKMAMVWRAWTDMCQLMAVCRKAVLVLANNMLIKAFNRWHEVMEEELEGLRLMRKAMNKIFKGALCKALMHWAQWADERNAMLASMRKVAGSWLRMEMGMCFRKWLEWWEHMCDQRDLVRRVLGRIQNSQMFGLWNFWRCLCSSARTAQHALARLMQHNLGNAFITWLETCTHLRDARQRREQQKRANEWAPDAWLLGPDMSYGGEGSSRQFLGVVEIGRDDLTETRPQVEWDVSGRYDQGTLEWDRGGREILSPVAERGPGDELDASELLAQRMQTMNAMFDEVESLTLDLEREMFQPTETSRTKGLSQTRRVRTMSKPPSSEHDGRWPAPPR
eukprot:TRINITY_DN4320_c0_g1_i1.p1 TRINITY_DN4320_c0_g1~~TRINITY_DN4320_c0_g1_i1.p1  ORF type:complete len:663 (+),score=151.43 TRINITY_DN4320_c0_g1_i1:360-2348(+)